MNRWEDSNALVKDSFLELFFETLIKCGIIPP